jgi:gluconolactonase
MERLGLFLGLCGIVAAVAIARGQTPQASRPMGAVVRVDPALDALVSPDAKVETLREDYFGIAESPLWVREGGSGYLLFSDIAANAIYKWTPPGTLSVHLERSGFTAGDPTNVNIVSNGRLAVTTSGSNGLALDREGRIVLCAQGDRAIVRIEKDGTRTVIADRYDGKRLNGPNDLVIKSDGAVYFTDQSIGLRGGARSPLRELAFHGVFRASNGRVDLLDDSLPAPNGLAFSPDERHLYVDSGRTVFRYDLRPDGGVENRQVFFTLAGDGPGGADGMVVDEAGNIYLADHVVVWVLSSSGRHLGTIRIPDATNLAFGDGDRRTLYVTSRRSMYRLRVNIPGLP